MQRAILLITVVCCMACVLHAQEVLVPLNNGWRFQQVGKDRWYDAEVPGVVQTDLLRHGLIPDFYRGSNIDSVQWIENEDWEYRRTILVADTLLRHGHLDLVFKGLDTFAEVYLNDSLVGRANNMFRTWEWEVKDLLREGPNELRVIFRSPIREGAKLRDAYGIQLPHDNDPSGVSPYIRKAAYQFGWDFCPRLVTSGIWQGVELRGWSVGRIRQVVPTQFDHGNTVHLKVVVDSDGAVGELDSKCGTTVQLWEPDSERPAVLNCSGHLDGVTFRIKRPKRWDPRGSGEQPLYRVRTRLTCDDTVRSVHEMRIGIRTVEFDTTRDADGQAFAFKVNGKNVFMKGCNIVPPHMVPSLDADRKWVELVKHMCEAGMNMVRVWAGGIYPPDAFFDACDTAGILVWQDHMYAQLPPGSKSFMENAEQEAFQQQHRLLRHPSLAIWCGNNELDVAWKNWGWQERYHLHGADSISVANASTELFNARNGYLSPFFRSPLYTPTSPLSNWGNAEGLTRGDLHYWGVWHGDSAFSSFANNVGRFVSEYGFQSYPDSALLARYNPPSELYLGSPTMKRLQRSYKTDKPIIDAIKRELGVEPRTLGAFIRASQEVQARAYRMAIEAHLGARPRCMGTLFWQLNDCWPGPSWSLIDYEGHWKPGMYAVQRAYQQEH
ncbi:MAG: glycoside hydrolase family 2 protein [Bacteroidetes bacterium]|nr:glycoside hydrolase family 2 protein [Bacteroidota bacterium]MBX7130410.1 hypothetical protein [Flavobacteriales bacterium]MCC6655508.1 glycoside hydrolase family 2 protein [Flavobacteriales bacterium]HMU12693.1 hypothetical protein [Flavobacteriales bacterium]HNA31705.1 hypothetical protein [Flavobacteriales bacterium]